MRQQQKAWFVMLAIASLTSVSAAQRWEFKFLSPRGGTYYVFGTDGEQYAGYGGNPLKATLWNSAIGTTVDLHPPGFEYSQAYGVKASRQVGSATNGNVPIAGFWSGTAESFQALQSPGATSSVARDLDGSLIGGWAIIGGTQRAVLWDTSLGTFTDLHPSGASSSFVRKTRGGLQVGSAAFNGTDQAAVWNGSAESHVSLKNPTPWPCNANGTDGVGFVGTSRQSPVRGFYWPSLDADPIDMTGQGGKASNVSGIWGPYQVGEVYDGGWRASLWTGSAESRHDLHQYVPDGQASVARDIWVTGVGHVLVTGTVGLQSGGLERVAVWRLIPDIKHFVTDVRVQTGRNIGGNPRGLDEVDGQTYDVENRAVPGVENYPIDVRVSSLSDIEQPSRLRLSVALAATQFGLAATLQLWNWNNNEWDSADTVSAPLVLTNVNMDLEGSGKLGRYVRFGDGLLRARILVRAVSPVGNSSWRVKLDKARWEITP